MRTLYLHVGQDKTGSSYIQSSLANSVDLLKEKGIFYPTNKRILKAVGGKISSGNGSLLNLENESAYEGIGESDSILISSEQLFRVLPKKDYFDDFTKFLTEFNVTNISCLLYIREPLEHLSSAYQQAIKRGGYELSIEEFAKQYLHTKRVYQFVKFCKNSDLLDLKIINYSDKKDQLIHTFENWLTLPVDTLKRPTVSVVNRSMTKSELEFQRVANGFFGKKASFISDALCEILPEKKSDQIGIPIDVQKQVIENLSVFCNFINEYSKTLADSDVYQLSMVPENIESKDYVFDREQIEVIASSIANHFNVKIED